MDPPSAAVTYHAGFEIVCLAAMGACASEFISWVLIYRKQEYQRLSASIEKASTRLEKEKEVPVKGGKNKNLVRVEKELGRENRDMAVLRMKSSVAAGMAHALVFSHIYNKYDGQAVARLPFEPFSFVRHLSHRNLPGSDFCECSVVFFYMLCSLCLRPNLQRALGFAPANTPSLMKMQEQMLTKLQA